MGEDGPEQDLSIEVTHLRADLDPRHARAAEDAHFYEARQQLSASPAHSRADTDHAAVAVLEHIYSDMIAALQQMYRDTIAAKDDALAGRDRELETKDALIDHLRRRAEEAEARASQALRYIGELDRADTTGRSAEPSANGRAKPGVFARLFRKR